MQIPWGLPGVVGWGFMVFLKKFFYEPVGGKRYIGKDSSKHSLIVLID